MKVKRVEADDWLIGGAADWPVGEGIPPHRALNHEVDTTHR
jgi:hypothetical protein